MIEHKMRVRHSPPDTYGDCIRVCIASMLNIALPSAVPHFFYDGCDSETGLERIEKYLRNEHSLTTFSIMFPECVGVQTIMDTIGLSNPGIHYIMLGSTADGTPHAVVCCNNEVVNNPSPWPADIDRGTNEVISIIVFVTDVLR